MKFKKQLFTIVLLSISIFSVHAQDKAISESTSSNFERKADKVSLGFGLGLDYGGIGGNITAYPVKNIGLFVGVGSNIIGLGYNVGAKFRYVEPSSILSPFVTIMYGYNTVVAVEDDSSLNKTFYGMTYGLGVDFRLSKHSNNYFSVGVLLPQRGSEVDKYMDDNGIVLETDLPSYAVSLGYRIILK